LFALCCSIVACLTSVFALTHIRFASGKSLVGGVIDSGEDDDDCDENGTDLEVTIPFQRVTLAFKDIHYFVKASTTDEKLELLKGVDGVIEAGKMTALMGSSGAGKTTLMCGRCSGFFVSAS
jgi:ABC-type multidrug transport system fused ATPase/permease subunit